MPKSTNALSHWALPRTSVNNKPTTMIWLMPRTKATAASLSKRIPARRARYATIRAKMAAPTACAARKVIGSGTNRFSMEHLLNCVVQNKPARINQDGAAGDALCLGCIVCDYQGSQMIGHHVASIYSHAESR